MMRAIVFASLSGAALAQDSVTGMPGCACLGALPDSVADIDCDYDWAFNGKCVKTVGLVSNFTTYAGDYGESCKAHKEPGHSACFDITVTPPVEKPPTDQADWCNAKWCYIDPCNCDASDATKSDYFPDSLFYSYATCGDKNTYTALESATNTVGNAECNQAAAPAADAPAAAAPAADAPAAAAPAPAAAAPAATAGSLSCNVGTKTSYSGCGAGVKDADTFAETACGSGSDKCLTLQYSAEAGGCTTSSAVGYCVTSATTCEYYDKTYKGVDAYKDYACSECEKDNCNTKDTKSGGGSGGSSADNAHGAAISIVMLGAICIFTWA